MEFHDIDKRLTKVENDVEDIKGKVKITEGSMQEMTLILKEYTIKQDVTNEFLKELLDKMDSKIELYKEVNDDRYIELIKSNSQQDVKIQTPKADKATDAVIDIAKDTLQTKNQIRLVDRKEVWGVIALIVGGLITYFSK